MTDELKTIAQIAAELGVSRQAVYKKLKNNPELTTSLQPYVTTKGKLTVYSLQGQELIKQSFQNSDVNRTDNQCVNQSVNHDNQVLASLQDANNLLKSQLDVLKADNNSLRDKIADRDKTIERLEQDKAKLNERLDKADTNISNLTTALTAAQALHGMDKQQAVIEVKADGERSEPSSTTTQDQTPTPEEPQRKLSFFARLFKRN